MISWLKGKKINTWTNGNKEGIIIACNGIGFDVQLLPRYLKNLICSNSIELWIHQVQRDDGFSLYGFNTVDERDLFRKLLSVNGVGPQIGISLLEDWKVNQLIKAIINKEIYILTKSQGVGKRMAEKIIFDLSNKLIDFNYKEDLNSDDITSINSNSKDNETLKEIKATLKSLGYDSTETKTALEASSTKIIKEEGEEIINSITYSDRLLKETIIRLSQNTS